jgi:putative endonuclease
LPRLIHIGMLMIFNKSCDTGNSTSVSWYIFLYICLVFLTFRSRFTHKNVKRSGNGEFRGVMHRAIFGVFSGAMCTYYVYILRCSDDSYYIGVTNDYKSRFADHQDGKDAQCYTYTRRPLTLMYVESYGYVMNAIRREKQLKGWSRKKKEALMNEDWKNLMELSQSTYTRRIENFRVLVRRAHHDTCGSIRILDEQKEFEI